MARCRNQKAEACGAGFANTNHVVLQVRLCNLDARAAGLHTLARLLGILQRRDELLGAAVRVDEIRIGES